MTNDRLPRLAQDYYIRKIQTTYSNIIRKGFCRSAAGAPTARRRWRLRACDTHGLRPLAAVRIRKQSLPFHRPVENRKYMVILPRQARDKHRERSTQKRDVAFSYRPTAMPGLTAPATTCTLYEGNAAFALRFRYIKRKRSILPRQARDKQFIKKNATDRSSAGQDRLLLHAAPPRPQHHLARRFRRLRGLQNEPVEPFLHKHDRFTKTGSGQA